MQRRRTSEWAVKPHDRVAGVSSTSGPYEHGFATLLVLFVTVVIGTIGLGALIWTRWHLHEAQRLIHELQLEQALGEGLHWALTQMRVDVTPQVDWEQEPWFGEHWPNTIWKNQQQRLRVTISDASNRVNFNSLDASMVESIPNLSVEQRARLINWRQDSSFGASQQTVQVGLLDSIAQLRIFPELESVIPVLEQTFTAIGPININVCPPETFVALLMTVGMSEFRAKAATDSLIAARKQGEMISDLDQLFALLPALESNTITILKNVLQVDGTVNINTAQEAVLRYLFQALGAREDAVASVISRRAGRPIRSIEELSSIVRDSTVLTRLAQWFTVRSRYFNVRVEVVEVGNGTVRAWGEGVAQREWDDARKRWTITIVRWAQII